MIQITEFRVFINNQDFYITLNYITDYLNESVKPLDSFVGKFIL